MKGGKKLKRFLHDAKREQRRMIGGMMGGPPRVRDGTGGSVRKGAERGGESICNTHSGENDERDS